MELIHLLRNTLSVPLFLALMISLLNLFTSLSAFIMKDMEVAPEIAVEITASSLTGIIILFSLTLCGSKIPETMSDIKETAGKLLVRNAKYKLQYGLDNEAIYLLRRVEKHQIIHLSACGMVEIKKSYLISAIGGLFTYGLLILNFKMRDFQEW
ncbi:hypothetical protein JTE90_007277 [Oedothorax gibbosus]|uniref:Uncharacterized protein n=1 Tax=Oedothorax gibbosus TaxID=931172 RepID=A0AAV6VN03_9ARAC|nr:hypothetical protein JTE90_007277 [Oedothorax gibbosus]